MGGIFGLKSSWFLSPESFKSLGGLVYFLFGCFWLVGWFNLRSTSGNFSDVVK